MIKRLAVTALLVLMPLRASAEVAIGVSEATRKLYRSSLEKFGAVRAQHILCVGETSALKSVTVTVLTGAERFGMTIDQAVDVVEDGAIFKRRLMNFRCTKQTDTTGEYKEALEQAEASLKADRAKARKPSQ